MTRKGAAPLIDEVNLILIVVGIVSLMTVWGTGILNNNTDPLEQEAERLIDCSMANMMIHQVQTRPTGTKIFVANTGRETFVRDVIITLSLNNASLYQQRITGGLKTGAVDSTTVFNAATSKDQIEQVQVTSLDCPEITDRQTQFR